MLATVPPFAKILLVVLAVGGAFVLWVQGEPERSLREREEAWGVRISAGDLVFQDLDCGLRCQLIREITQSRYSHVGIVLEEDGERFVWEAFHPVGPTPLVEWVERGRGRAVAIYRPRERLAGRRQEIEREVRALAGRPYDGLYLWDDERIYCSELYAKAVNAAEREAVFEPHPPGPGAFGARAELIRSLSSGKLTEATPMVTPRDLTQSPLLRRLVDELAN